MGAGSHREPLGTESGQGLSAQQVIRGDTKHIGQTHQNVNGVPGCLNCGVDGKTAKEINL